MNRPSFLASQIFLASLCVAALSLATAPPAHAGLGDLVKEAKDKAAETVTQKAGDKAAESVSAPEASGGVVEFNDVILELTNDRLDHFLTGMKAAGGGAAERSALVAKKNAVIAQEDALLDKNSKAIDAAREKHNEASRCCDESISEGKDARDEAMRQKLMSDPVQRNKMIESAQAMGMAQAKGDTATMNRLQREMAGLTAPTAADSALARKKCGPVPPLHPAGVQVEALQAQAAAIHEQIRDKDKQSSAARAKASGMNETQFAMAQERIQMYLDAIKAKGKPRGFTSDELAALATHKDALKTALD